jgi:hypothetical protein
MFGIRATPPDHLIIFLQCCEVGAEEPKLKCLPEPKLRITALDPYPFYQNFIEKSHGYINPRKKAKEGNFYGTQ